MRYLIMRLTPVAIVVGLLAPTFTSAHDAHPRHDAVHARQAADKRCGDKKEAGRNIIKDGIKTKDGIRRPNKTEVKQYKQRLNGLCRPQPKPAQTPSGQASSTNAYQGGGAGGAERFAQCESGGSYTARNGVHYGKYQINVPLHYGRGVCRGLDTSPAGQDQCAGRIMQSQGSGAWAQCGG